MILEEIFQLFFPKLCVACNGSLMKNENFLCSNCLFHLPQTNFHLTPENTLEKVFWGRVKLESAMAFVYFKKGEAMQQVLHEIKYKDNKELAQFLGIYYGSILQASNKKFDAIAAIPLHKSKLRKRGYNQSECIVNGLVQSMQIPNVSAALTRLKFTETQTRKGRFERWENVDDVFKVETPEAIAGKHILLIDDVITTGATIEACAKVMLDTNGTKVSVASIAFASN